MSEGPLARYRALLASGRLKPDSDQARVAAALDALAQGLKHYKPRSNGTLSSFFGARAPSAPKGLYIHGTVGRGKSLLMDLFFDAVEISEKRRVHFNAFMMEKHQRIHEWRQLDQRERNRRAEYVREAGDDPIAPVAKRIAAENWLLCFDEFQVTDVADAMILGRLFEKLFAAGAVIILTSNIAPDRLYEGGLNRPLFLPFIAAIKSHLDVLELGGKQDYRLDRMAGVKMYNTPLGAEATHALDEAWQRLTDNAAGAEISLEVFGRPLTVPRAAKGVARFSFADLCEQPLGASDYVVLAQNFHTLLLDDIPLLPEDRRNEARRLTLLIDTLYDERAKLICSAAAPPNALVTLTDDTAWFARTASRLSEMQSEDYLKEPPRHFANAISKPAMG